MPAAAALGTTTLLHYNRVSPASRSRSGLDPRRRRDLASRAAYDNGSLRRGVRLDAGLFAAPVANQSSVLDPAAPAWFNSASMVVYVLGGSAGTANGQPVTTLGRGGA